MKSITKKLTLFALSCLLLASPVMPLFASARAYATSYTGQWINEDTIIIGPATGKHATYNKDGTGNFDYLAPSPGPTIGPGGATSGAICPNTIVVSNDPSNPNSSGTITLSHWVLTSVGKSFRYKCEPEDGGKPQPITLTDTENATTPSSGSSSSSSGPAFVCNTGTILGFIPNPLDFILCGIINGLYLIVSTLDGQINDILEIGTSNTSSDDPDQIFADTNSVNCGSGTSCPAYQDADAYQQAWMQFRNIALALLVVVTLGIVIAQALGMEILDAYTIRKMLPRVLIATIAITLSWQIMRFLVTLSNDLGFGIGSLIAAPFTKLGINITFGAGGSILALATGAAFTAAFDLVGLLGFVGTAALAVLVTFIVLIVRQIAVILLVIMAPLAMIAYILPGTQRAYKFWWESLSRMLLMFPMIVGFITAGHIFAAIASNNAKAAGGTTGLVDTCIALFAYFAPYFMVPMTFRFSGAMMGTIGNAINSRADGARGALRQMRNNRAQRHLADMRTGERFKGAIPGTTKAAEKLNKFTRRAGVGWQGRYGFGQRGREATAMVEQEARDAALKNPKIQAIKGKNDFNRVLAEGMGDARQGREGLIRHLMSGGDDGRTFLKRNEAEARADVAVKAAKAAGGFTVGNGIAAYYNMARDGTAIRDEEDLARLAAKAGQGNANNTFTYAAEGASLSKGANRPDLAPATERIGEHAFRQSDILFNNGAPKMYDPAKEGKKVKTDTELATDARLSAIGNTQDYEWFTQAKGRALRNSSSFLSEVVANKEGKYTAEQQQQAATQMTSRLSAIRSGLGADNKRIEAYEALAAPLDEADLEAGKTGLDHYNEYVEAPTGGTKTESQQVRTYVKQDVLGTVTKEVVQPETVTRNETRRDQIAEVGGIDRQRGLNAAQIEEQMRGRGGGPTEPEEQ